MKKNEELENNQGKNSLSAQKQESETVLIPLKNIPDERKKSGTKVTINGEDYIEVSIAVRNNRPKPGYSDRRATHED